jgi:hypothetical protein
MHLMAHKIDAEFARLASAPDEIESGVVALVGCLHVLVKAYPRAAQVSLPPERVAGWEKSHQAWLQSVWQQLPAKFREPMKASAEKTFQALKDAYEPLANTTEDPKALSGQELLQSGRAQECVASVVLLLGERLDREFGFLKQEPWPTDMGFLAWLTGIQALVKMFPEATKSQLSSARIEDWSQLYCQWFERVERRLPAKHRAELRAHALCEFERLLALIA